MSTARVTSPRGPTVIITAVAGLVVTLVLMLLASPCCTNDDGGIALASVTTSAGDGGHPGSVASEHCPGRVPVVDAAVRLGAWTPMGVAVVAVLLAVAAAVRRSDPRGDRPVARYALCVMRT